jgi:hypothetical protein
MTDMHTLLTHYAEGPEQLEAALAGLDLIVQANQLCNHWN